MEGADIKPKWFKYCKNPTPENRKALEAYLSSMDSSELEELKQNNPGLLTNPSILCKVLQEDYTYKLKRNSQCHNETTIAMNNILKDPFTIQELSENEITDEIKFTAVRLQPYCLPYVPKQLRTNELNELAVSLCGLVLRYMDDDEKTYKINFLAVTQIPDAIKYVPIGKRNGELMNIASKQKSELRRYSDEN